MPLNRRGSVSARLSVWFSRDERSAERREVDRERLEPARVVRRERVLAPHDVQRRPLLRAGLGQHERAVREVERGQRMRPASLAPGSFQCSRPAIIRCRTRHRSSSRPSAMRLPRRRRPADVPAVRCGERRVDRAQQERAGQPHALERPIQDAPLQRLEVDRDVGQLRHGANCRM